MEAESLHNPVAAVEAGDVDAEVSHNDDAQLLRSFINVFAS